MTTDEVAAFLQLSKRTLIRMRERGTGPSWMLMGRSIRYNPRSVAEYAASRERGGKA